MRKIILTPHNVPVAWTTEDLEAIQTAIKSGVTRVQRSDGSSVDYRSIEELIAIEKMIKKELGIETISRKPKFFNPEIKKG